MKFIYYRLILIFLFCFEGNFFPQNFVEKNNSLQPVIILPLGNSITYDSRSNDMRSIGEKAGYRAPLYNFLKNAGYSFDFIGSEHSGGNYLPAGYDEHAGFPGITDDQLLNLLITGRLVIPSADIDRQITVGPYLNTYSPDIILLHIGTNGNDQPNGTSAHEVEQILNVIDNFEINSGKSVTVILARIINRVPNQNYVNVFNNNIEAMALDRVNNPSNYAYPDKIVIVDMQDSAGINYSISADPESGMGDMYDALHPNKSGYDKMALKWFNAIASVLPSPPKILKQPKNQYTIEGESAVFKISVSGPKPLNFIWKKNGSTISGQNDSILYLNNVNLSDSNSLFHCIISNPNGTVSTEKVKLFITPKPNRVKFNLITEYDFEEGTGDIIYNKVENNNELNLNIFSADAIEWIPNGLQIKSSSNISTLSSALPLYNFITESNELSVELWFSTTILNQSAPSKILTISENNNARNFTLSQNYSQIAINLRTTQTDLNGLPNFQSDTNIVNEKLTHLIFTRKSNGEAYLFIDGELVKQSIISGNFSNWSNDYKLKIANEFDIDNPWLGNIYLLAIYNRGLSENEIIHHYLLGPNPITNVIKNSSVLPTHFSLSQNYPNPFNPSTTINFGLPQNSWVTITIYNMLGQKVMTLVDESLSAGVHNIEFDASKLTSGIYIYSLSAQGVNGNYFVSSKKMILMK